jgi:hypothetical protein
VLGLAQRDRIVAKYLDGARHGVDFVGAAVAGDGGVEIALGHPGHGGGHLLRRARDEPAAQ